MLKMVILLYTKTQGLANYFDPSKSRGNRVSFS